MKKTKRMKKMAACLVAVVLVVMCPFMVSANEPNVEQGVRIVETAGMHGYYSYDAITGIETFVPAADYAPQNVMEETVVPQVEGDPNVLGNELTEYYEDDISAFPAYDETLTDVEPYSIIYPDGRKPVASVSGQYIYMLDCCKVP